MGLVHGLREKEISELEKEKKIVRRSGFGLGLHEMRREKQRRERDGLQTWALEKLEGREEKEVDGLGLMNWAWELNRKEKKNRKEKQNWVQWVGLRD